MAIFGKWKDKLDEPATREAPVDEFVPPSDLPEVEENSADMNMGVPAIAPMPPEKRAEESAENLAPVFVKISKYKDILNTVNYLKMGFGVIKSQISILSKLIKMERDNMDLLYAALEKVSGQLNKLDSDFTKPVDFMREVADMKVQDVRGLESSMDDLKSQIEKLKSEVETLA